MVHIIRRILLRMFRAHLLVGIKIKSQALRFNRVKIETSPTSQTHLQLKKSKKSNKNQNPIPNINYQIFYNLQLMLKLMI